MFCTKLFFKYLWFISEEPPHTISYWEKLHWSPEKTVTCLFLASCQSRRFVMPSTSIDQGQEMKAAVSQPQRAGWAPDWEKYPLVPARWRYIVYYIVCDWNSNKTWFLFSLQGTTHPTAVFHSLQARYWRHKLLFLCVHTLIFMKDKAFTRQPKIRYALAKVSGSATFPARLPAATRNPSRNCCWCQIHCGGGEDDPFHFGLSGCWKGSAFWSQCIKM